MSLNTMSQLNLIDGLNINPISLEFSQELTTTKILASMEAKINQVIDYTNDWYTKIFNDLQNNGELANLINQTIFSNLDNKVSQNTQSITNMQQELDSNMATIESEITEINTIVPLKSTIYIGDALPDVSVRKNDTIYLKTTFDSSSNTNLLDGGTF